MEIGDVIETADGHQACALTLGETTMLVRYDDGDQRRLDRPAEPYLCKTCGATVQPGERHEHSCPLEEGDSCGARRCNETGLCQA